jgi:hypothetical protein
MLSYHKRHRFSVTIMRTPNLVLKVTAGMMLRHIFLLYRHTHDRTYRKRDMTKCFNQRDVTRRRDRQTGLADVAYKLTGIHELKIDGAPITVINIMLSCDKRLTPWCNCSDTGGKKPSNETNAVKSNISNKNIKNRLNQ